MLAISHLSARYHGQIALHDINLALNAGELTVVLGPSGCGKTTLLNLIAGFLPVEEGQITLAGKKITGPGAERGVVFQHEGLLPWRNVLDNVAFGLQLAGMDAGTRRHIAEKMLKKVGLEGTGKRFIWQLSGGMRQRVGIARALAARPEVLLCDEATSALDPETTASVLALLADINQRLNLTIVLITHQLEVVKTICDHAALLEQGEIVESGKLADLLVTPWSRLRQSLLHDPQAEQEFLTRHGVQGRPLCGVA